MFLHTPTFKKLIKASYKNGGITVGRLDSRSLFVAGNYWITWFDYTSIPNRIRAAIIEYTGELPEVGEIFKAKVDEPNQYEMPFKEHYDVHKSWQQAMNPLIATPVFISGHHSLYQIFQDKENRFIPVSSIHIDLIDRREQEECEGSVIGPSTRDHGLDYAPTLYWYSDLCILGIMSVHLDHEDALKALEALKDTDFHKKEE